MFGLGDLFQEADDNCSGNTECKQTKSGVYSGHPLPPSPRPSAGLCGIYNQGATCYMNSLLQTLVMTPEFRENLFNLGTDELGTLKTEQNNQKVRVIPLKLQHLFARLLLLNAQAASTAELTDSFGWNNNEELIQHDVQELNRILFSAIEESLVGTSGQNMIHKLYHGVIVNQIVCEECGKTSEHEEEFLDLCVTVSGSSSLEESLSRYYIQTEALDGNNQYKCGSCNKLVNAKKGAKLRHLPPLLTISLLRFRFDFQKQERYKDTTKFKFPLDLDMTPFVEDVSKADCSEYELFSVVNHSGGAHGGHYTAYIRDIDSLGHWTHPNDEDIQVTPDPKSGKVDLIECDSPVELIQVILNKCADKGMPVDKLCMEINKQTGVSWNKRFKSRYGPINKFLKKHTDKFVTSTDNYVHLRTASSVNLVNNSHANGNCTDRNMTANDGMAAKRNRLRSPIPEPGHCWFHFNDSRVRPIRTRDLEKLYAGKSSAYMLFYRRKSLLRPPQARENPQYMMPNHLIQLIRNENEELEKQRKMYEVKMNMILIKLLFPQLLTLKQGALQTKDSVLSYVELAVDKRKTVAELLHQIEDTYGELMFGDFVVHFAKLLPAGIHVYHCISDERNKVIAELDIADKGFLLVWDGKQINGEEIQTGVINEPVLLTVSCHGYTQCNHAFRKSMTVRELKHEMCHLARRDPQKTIISRVTATGDDTDVTQLLPEHQDKTLAELNITNGDRFLLEDLSEKTEARHVYKEKTKEDQTGVSYLVENRLGKMISGEWPTLSIKIQPDMSVAQLKARLLSELSDKSLENCVCRIRPEDDNLGLLPPVPDGVLLCDAGIKANSKIVLEPGVAPETDQLCLTVEPVKHGANRDNIEVIVSGHKTVRQLLQTVIDKAGELGIEWHLRRTNWCGEAAEVLDDLDLTLVECLLKSGDHLLLEEGLLPPKGFLKLNIQLYPTAASIKCNYADVLASLAKGVNGLVSSHHTTDNNVPVPMGEIVIAASDTLEDLKLMILTLPEGDNLIVPTIDFLRVRLIEDGHLTTVLKDHKQTLQRLKLTNDMTLGVQLLKDEENLGNQDMLLEIKLHVPGSRTYLPSTELIWNTSSGATPASLRHAIANHLSVPSHKLVLAKYCPVKYEWLIIQEEPQHKNNHQKEKKKGQKKVNLKQAPYQIKDGAIIGVKDLEYEKTDVNDFCTQTDLDGKEKLRIEAEEKKRRREQMRAAAATPNSGFGKQHKEVAIKIHVDNFR